MTNNPLAYILHLLLIFGMYAVSSVIIYHYEHPFDTHLFQQLGEILSNPLSQ